MEGDDSDLGASMDAGDEEEEVKEEYDLLKETGELDLPEDEESQSEEESDDEISDNDGHLADYYRELGISKEMKGTLKSSEPVYKVT
jgi:hypothetical protein